MSYEEKCLEADKELADSLGWEWHEGTAKHRTGPTWDTWEWIGPCGAVDPVTHFSCIRWTQNDAAAFQLAVEQELDFHWGIYGITIANPDNDCEHAFVKIEDFPSKAAAVRFAIVKTVITKLKGN